MLSTTMRLIFAVLAGWIIYYILFLILSLLFTLIGSSDLITRYSGLSKEETAQLFSQNPVDLLKFGFGLLLASLTSVSISSFISGLIAHHRSITIGVLVASIQILIQLGVTPEKGIHFGEFLFIMIILFIGGLFGLLGEKFYDRFIKD